MTVLTVDLASKFSAVCVMADSGEVYREFDSRGKTSFGFALEIRKALIDYPDTRLVIIEDVPYGISRQAMIKPVLRVQGILIGALARWIDQILFVNPSTWQKTYPGVARGKEADRIEAARVAAAKLGYTPPDLVGDYVDSLPEGAKVLKKHTNPLEKTMTDYIDAFLMARWVLSFTPEELRSQSGVQPVFI